MKKRDSPALGLRNSAHIAGVKVRALKPENAVETAMVRANCLFDASIDEVLVTFAETTLIVMLVILLFLQNWRAVIIPIDGAGRYFDVLA